MVYLAWQRMRRQEVSPPPFLFHTEWPCLSVLSCIVALVRDSSVLRKGNAVLSLDLQGAPRTICLIQWPFRLLTMWGVIGGKPTNYLCLKPAASHNSDDLPQRLVCWHKRLLWEKGLPACLGLRDRVKCVMALQPIQASLPEYWCVPENRPFQGENVSKTSE